MQVKQQQNKEGSSNYQILTGKERPRINEKHEGKSHYLLENLHRHYKRKFSRETKRVIVAKTKMATRAKETEKETKRHATRPPASMS
jgi:hypothetical protein